MKITITLAWDKNSKDITIDSNQKIETTIRVMEENVSDFPRYDSIKEIREKKRNRRLMIQNTYAQEKIYSGDVVFVKTDVAQNESDMTDITIDEIRDEVKAVIKETSKKSDFNILSAVDMQRLIYRHDGFLDSSYEEEGEDITFYYDVEDKSTFSKLKEDSAENKYSFLINVDYILNALDDFSSKIDEGNIYYDRNYVPFLKRRDIYQNEDERPTDQEKVQIYKACIAVILLDKGKLKDYVNGTETVSSDKRFAPYKDCLTVSELKSVLIAEKAKYIKKLGTTTKRVNKKAYLIKTILAFSMSAVAITFLALFIRYAIFIYPNTQACLNGQKAYLRKEYVSCIDSLKNVELKSMDYETKYVLAVSYAKMENLNKEEINNIVERLTLTTSERELEYWIYLGRNDFAMAEDAAKFVMDDRLLVYAYMKEYDNLDMRTDISGEEKSARMEELKKMISELGKKYTPSEE